MTIKFNRHFEISDIDQLHDLFDENSCVKIEIGSESSSFLKDQQIEEETELIIILLNEQTKESWISLPEYEEFDMNNLDPKMFLKTIFASIIVFLVKWGHIIIDNELEDFLTEDQYSIWYLRDMLELSYAEIARIRKHTKKSGNESTIRSLYMKTRIKLLRLLNLCDKYSEKIRGTKGW